MSGALGRRRPTGRRGQRPSEPERPPLLAPTSDLLKDLGPLPETTCVHLDAGYDSNLMRILLTERGPQGAIAQKGLPAPLQATKRWPAERTHTWHNNYYKLARGTERPQVVADFNIAFTNTIVLARRLLHRTWILYRWNTRPSRRP